MIRTAILAFDGSPLSSIGLPADILNAAGTLWNMVNGQERNPYFSVSIVTPDGKPVRCNMTVQLHPDGSLFDLEQPDLVIISGITALGRITERFGEVARHLERLHSQGCCLASICSGAFVLAETGLLDGKTATTHWGMAPMFRKTFPKVHLETRNLIAEHDNILCSGGTTAGADLSLHLIRKFCGEVEANRCARVLLLDPNRSTQSPYEQLNIPFEHGDLEVTEVQQWITVNYQSEVTVQKLANIGRMSRRTFERRFKQATGYSPLRYLQRVRVESAKRLLETTNKTFEEITCRVGYGDTSSFRRIFQKELGLPPSVYREKFSRRVLPATA